MPRFLALDWDQQQLYLVSAASRAGKLHLERALVSKEELPLNLVTAEDLGKRLRWLLKDKRVAPAPVVACVGRDRIIIKEILYPPVPAHEELAVIRFQALKELSHSPDEVVIDYYPVGEGGPNGERRALVLILRRELLTTYQDLCRAAGLKLVALTPRPFGLASCVGQAIAVGKVPAPETAEVAQAVLAISDRWAEFCVIQDGVLLYARSMATPAPGAETTLLGEIRRNLAVYAGQAPQHPVRSLYLASGGERDRFADLLKGSLAIPVHTFDPLAGMNEPLPPPEQRGSFAGVVGLLQTQVERRGRSINFLQPKQAKPPREGNRTRLAIAVAAAAVVLLGLVGLAYASLAHRDQEIKELNEAKIQLDGQLALIEDEAKRIKAVEEWASTEIVWLDELYDLTERFPEGNALRLTQLTADPLTRTGKASQVAKLTLKGIATNNYQQVDTLLTRLVEESHYRVEPKVISRNTGVDRSRFPQQFSTRVDLEPRPPSGYRLRLTVKAPSKARNQDEEEDLDMDLDNVGGQP